MDGTPEISPATAKRFCEALDTIDDLVDQINREGAVIEVPADLGRILSRLGERFGAVAEAAPTPNLEEAMLTAATTFNDAAETLLHDPPLVGVERAQEIYAEAMGGIEDAGADVSVFRAEHCSGDDDS